MDSDLKDIIVTRKKINPKGYIKQFSKDGDCKIKITEKNIRILDQDGKVLAILLSIPQEETNQAYDNVTKVQYTSGRRASGMVTVSSVFGYQPRNPVLGMDWCTSGQLSYRTPSVDKYLKKLASYFACLYEEAAPDYFDKHDAWTKQNVLPEWQYADSPFTSGIINNNTTLLYHLDRGNLADAWSAMIVLKKNIEGGNLNIPELDVELCFEDGDLLFFNGSDLIHGVTPFKKIIPSGYRYSVVFYTLEKMCKCLTMREELNRGRLAMDKKTINRVQR